LPLLDIILGYDCNLACDYCTITREMRLRALSTEDVVRALRSGRPDGYDRVSFTGGEPTIRPDLLSLVREAKRLGYADIKVQSNALLFTPKNVARLAEAGCNRFHVSIHTHVPERYDALVRRARTYDAMLAGLSAVIAGGHRLTVDLIIKSDTMADVPDAVRFLHARGVRSIHLWYVSLTDENRDNVASLPKMTVAMQFVSEALRFAEDHGIEVLSLHIPRCLLGEANLAHAWDPGADDVRVVTPDATFQLERSKITGQRYVAACDGCKHRDICPGLREDYLEVYGDAEIARARGVAATIRPTRTLPLV
jgi:cyclic pyranopterin phosphate synthase